MAPPSQLCDWKWEWGPQGSQAVGSVGLSCTCKKAKSVIVAQCRIWSWAGGGGERLSQRIKRGAQEQAAESKASSDGERVDFTGCAWRKRACSLLSSLSRNFSPSSWG